MSDIIDFGKHEEVEQEELKVSEVDEQWNNIFNEKLDSSTFVWLCEYSYPILEDGEGISFVKDIFAASSKRRVLDTLFDVIINPDVRRLSQFEYDIFDSSVDPYTKLREFFTREGTSLVITRIVMV